ncbi:MAG: ribonuclease J [Armatimonadetes bacterium]|nr:MAG: ribonuclease J [Armatimonadota bacterium]
MSQVSIVPLGGAGEIGKNMTVLQEGGEMIVVDAGLSFPTEEMHGVDIVIPDTTFLRENKEKIAGIILTHGHEDHIGALPYILPELDVPVYGTELTLMLLTRKLVDRATGYSPKTHVLEPKKKVRVGHFEIEPIHVTHSLPQSCAIAVWTGLGIVLFSGDFKFDFTPIDGRLSDIARFGELGDEGVVALLTDCTNVEFRGWSPSERTVRAGFERVFREATGRILITTFASNLHRIQQAMDVSREFRRKVAVVGRSMEQTVRIGLHMGILHDPGEVLISADEVDDYKDREVTLLVTGSQGEPMAALSRIAMDNHRLVTLHEGDTVVYSARPIPGNESAIYQTINRLYRGGAKVVFGQEEGVHVSGHGYAEELRLLVNLTRPDYIIPVHGEPRHVYHYFDIVAPMGYGEENIVVMENGMELLIEKGGAKFAGRVPCGRVLVDTAAVSDVPEETIRDRSALAREGVVVITVAIDSDAGQVIGEPEISARGLLTNDGELNELKDVLKKKLSNASLADLKDPKGVELVLDDSARHYLRKRLRKFPLVLTSVVDV